MRLRANCEPLPPGHPQHVGQALGVMRLAMCSQAKAVTDTFNLLSTMSTKLDAIGTMLLAQQPEPPAEVLDADAGVLTLEARTKDGTHLTHTVQTDSQAAAIASAEQAWGYKWNDLFERKLHDED